MSLLEIFTPIFSQLSGYVDADPSGIQFLAQSTVSASYVISVVTSQRKINSLETYIRYNFQLIDMKLSQKVDYDYVNSDAFMANFVQAVRAVEIAESDDKVKIIAQALAGCTLDSKINRTICMRILDQITVEEAILLQEVVRKYEEPVEKHPLVDENSLTSIGTSRVRSVCRGLFQLGLLENEKIGRWGGGNSNERWWSPSVLAQEVIGLLNSVPTDMQ